MFGPHYRQGCVLDKIEMRAGLEIVVAGVCPAWRRWRLCTPGMLLTGITTGMEQGTYCGTNERIAAAEYLH